MVVVSVSYPATEGSRFDLDYYLQTHMPLVRTRWGENGLQSIRLLRGIGGVGGGALGFHMVALLTFRSQADFEQAVQTQGREIMGDIKNFTDVRPVVQLNEELPNS